MAGIKKIGLYFGTFNPIHIGHLIIANHIAEFTDLDQVWFVVTPHNPHKKKKTLLDDIHRLTLVRIAVENYPKLQASNIEFDLPQPNYTIKTLTVLEEKYPEHQFSLLMGADNMYNLHKWKNYEILLARYPVYVYPRIVNETPKKLPEALHPFKKSFKKVEAPIIELSATFIRNAIKDGKNIRPMLPENVWKYIDEMNFYKK
jgi:nicotinate-nucleotide adenylyltransferase